LSGIRGGRTRESGEKKGEGEGGEREEEEGNEAFRKEEYDFAVKHYTEAIQQTPWDVTLYTNRALVSGKLELTCSFHIQPCLGLRQIFRNNF